MNMCNYPHCARNVYQDSKYCIFHAHDKDPKIFLEEITLAISNKQFDFTGFIFTTFMDFDRIDFTTSARFDGAIFQGEVAFKNCSFLKSHTLSEDYGATKVCLSFKRTIFKRNAKFKNCTFAAGKVKFAGTEFQENIELNENEIWHGIDFENISLEPKSEFKFQNPEFINPNIPDASKYDDAIRIKFSGIKFNEFLTHFSNINISPEKAVLNELDILNVPIFLFRNCRLKDVYFNDCNISLLSFYACPYFDKAHFISCMLKSRRVKFCHILPIYRRTSNVIFEDHFLYYIKKNSFSVEDIKSLENYYEIKGIDNYKEILNIYRRLKTLSDEEKNYRAASRFYINEFDIKRKDYFQSAKIKIRERNRLSNSLKYCTHTLYKMIAGYGERPLQSFSWFMIFTFIFATFHIINGFSITLIKDSREIFHSIQYKMDFSLEGINTLFTSEFWSDFLYSIGYTLYKILPLNYFKGLNFNFSDLNTNSFSIIISFLNFFLLVTLIVFTGMGLKRQFKRY